VPENPPSRDELEISVFGPGIGECTVVHIGDGDWIVIDSCLNRESRRPIALEYLEGMNVDVASRVRLVVATHWHDDHIKGIGETFSAAREAKFVDSSAYPLQKLVRLVKLASEASESTSATREYNSVLATMKKRREKGERADAVGPTRAIANRKLLALNSASRPFDSEVFSLSPSDGVISLAEAELAVALNAAKGGVRVPRQGPNQLSVALWLRVGALNVLLGADLEHVAGTTEGWRAILGSSERPSGFAKFFKVPHHGSKNADCPEVWSEMLVSRPIAVMTPYTSSRLPGMADIDRTRARAGRLLLTSPFSRRALPRRENAVEKTLREIAPKRRALEGGMGHVRVRCSALDEHDESRVELKNGAIECTSVD